MKIGQPVGERKILEMAGQVAEEQGVEVVGVNIFGKGRGRLLRITIDKEDGVTLGDCEVFSRRFETLLETEESLQEPYNLEVSSPGLDRPLTAVRDYERNIGKLARIITKEKIDNQNFFVGKIIAVEGNLIKLSVDNKKERYISLENISKARLEIEINIYGPRAHKGE